MEPAQLTTDVTLSVYFDSKVFVATKQGEKYRYYVNGRIIGRDEYLEKGGLEIWNQRQ